MPMSPRGIDEDEKKLASLQAGGTLHPHPEAVRDELFQKSVFFDARDLVQVKYEMLRSVETNGRPVSEASRVFGLSRVSYYQAQTAFRARGLPGLVPLKRGPKGGHKLTGEVMYFVDELLREEPSLKATELRVRIQERFGFTIHRRTVERMLLQRQKKTSGPK